MAHFSIGETAVVERRQQAGGSLIGLGAGCECGRAVLVADHAIEASGPDVLAVHSERDNVDISRNLRIGQTVTPNLCHLERAMLEKEPEHVLKAQLNEW